MSKFDAKHAALAAIDELMSELKNGESVERARRLLHNVVDNSTASQLWCLLLPIQKLAERETQ